MWTGRKSRTARKNIYQPAESRAAEGADPHDKVVLKALSLAGVIGGQAKLLDESETVLMTTALEYPLPGDAGYADVAVFVGGELAFLMEVKSKGEVQSASAWTRQVRNYEKAADVPVLLVLAHDLGEVQAEYLRIADVQVFDIRGLDR